MLMANKDLCKLIIQYEKQDNLLKTISDFIVQYYGNKNSVLNPVTIKKIVESRKNIFMGFRQNDSPEFVLTLLDIIDDTIKKVDKESKGIEPIYMLDIQDIIKCKYIPCLKSNVVPGKNLFLMLDIEKEFKTLDDCYRNFKQSIKLDNDEKYYCDNCKVKRIASKKTEIVNWSNHLIVWLKRFSRVGESRWTKNDQLINIPIKWRHDLLLQGAIIHSGNLSGGHYIYVGKIDDDWYLFNDSSVTKINNEEQLTNYLNRAYMLYYKK
jgi:ubiquitin C-terminal hydrolase